MKNAIICFLKYPEPGAVKTRLAEDLGEQGAADFYASMAERVITEIYPLNGDYDLLLFYDPSQPLERYQGWLGDTWAFREQEGDDLGERLYNAVCQALEEGYRKTILIGSDCVGMDEDFMTSVFQQLDATDFVLGPSNDGGYYLLGMKEEDHPWLFYDMPWSTEEVFEITHDRIEVRELEMHQLEERIDVDTIDDLIELRQKLPKEHFLAKKIDHIVVGKVTPSAAVNLGSEYATQLVDGFAGEEEENFDFEDILSQPLPAPAPKHEDS